MKVKIKAKTELGVEVMKAFKKQAGGFSVMKLTGLKVVVNKEDPYTLILSSSMFKGDKNVVNIEQVYQNIGMFWLKGLTAKVDYEVKLL